MAVPVQASAPSALAVPVQASAPSALAVPVCSAQLAGCSLQALAVPVQASAPSALAVPAQAKLFDEFMSSGEDWTNSTLVVMQRNEARSERRQTWEWLDREAWG